MNFIKDILRNNGDVFRKNLLLLMLSFSIVHCNAQVQNGDFETWLNLHPHIYEGEMLDSHLVLDPMHGDIKHWTYDYGVGISRTTDAYSGTYATIVHNWYTYAQTQLYYRDTISFYPTNLTGVYKYIRTDPADFATANVIVTSQTGDTIINETMSFGHDTQWTTFDMLLTQQQATTDAADSIFITFDNAETDCLAPNLSTCKLLYLDNINVESGGISGISESVADRFRIYPNPSSGRVMSEPFSGKVKVYTTDGRVVYSKMHGNEALELELPKGAFIVEIIANDGSRYTSRLIVY